MIVLVVDDEPHAREVFRRLVEASGREVVTADSVVHALAAIDAHDIDVALIDVVLGDGSGLQILAHLKRTHGHARAVVVSAYDQQDACIQTLALSLGADAFLVKPVGWSDLERLLDATEPVTNPRVEERM